MNVCAVIVVYNRKFSMTDSFISLLRVAKKFAYINLHEEVLELRKQLKCKEMELEMLKKGMLFHSDRGVQYCSKQTVNYLNAYQFKQSMSRKENCWDNAVAESFFKTLKAELIYGCK